MDGYLYTFTDPGLAMDKLCTLPAPKDVNVTVLSPGTSCSNRKVPSRTLRRNDHHTVGHHRLEGHRTRKSPNPFLPLP